MDVAIITGSGGLVGSEAALHFARLGMQVVGVDNDMRKAFFGDEASTAWNAARLERELGDSYRHVSMDVRDRDGMARLFAEHAGRISLIVHAAAQPSHDWAAREPFTDFDINAGATLGVLEAARQHAPDAPFIFTSTNKVYGDTPNRLPLVEQATRWEVDPSHQYAEHGIDESMTIDASMHSVFGASKVAADVMVQEYGRYFGMPTVCFRGGTLTGPQHSATALHGFLGYVMRCTMTGTPYTVFGYQGKQVRDAIHSSDLVASFEAFWRAPRAGEVYNMGGARHSHCSVLEAIQICERVAGRQLDWTYAEANRMGDHIWWVSDVRKFEQHYPEWSVRIGIEDIVREMHEANAERWVPA